MDSKVMGAECGLVVLRASRLEALVGPLQLMLEASKPSNPLAPQTLVAAHPGMKPWVVGELARHVGPDRIVANLDVKLPSTWLDELAASRLGHRAVALPHYRKTSLRWSLYELLDKTPLPNGVRDERMLRYINPETGRVSPDELARRRFQLSDRLAGVYSQYLVYRPDWLAAWEAGKDLFAAATSERDSLRGLEQELLAPLWRAVRSRLGEHRGILVQELTRALARDSGELEPLHVFGLSHLPPNELAVLSAYSRHAPVMLYVPDPCREYWAGLIGTQPNGPGRAATDAGAWRSYFAEESERLAKCEGEFWHDQGHPLIARWGRMGQHFFATLADESLVEDTRHHVDESGAVPNSRLDRLQESIRRLDPTLMAEDPDAADSLADASLRIHSTHTRLRELEILRDALLDARDRDGTLPGDMVVMAPDIRAYLPLLPSVFGTAGSTSERQLPYHLADVPVARGHRLFHVLEALLDMPQSRVTAPEVADLLDVPEIRRALDIDAEESATLVEMLRNSRVAWGLDSSHREAMGLPGISDCSFAWAMDRMIAGYVMADVAGPDEAHACELPDGVRLMPLPGPGGPTAHVLGALDRLLKEMAWWQDLPRQPRHASEWSSGLRERVDALLRIDTKDKAARAAMAAIHRSIEVIAAEPARNGLDPQLQFAIVRDLLTESLQAVPERQRFLMGGVTFCGMVAQRAIPFDVVAVLGLNDGEFPRAVPDGGLDLMGRLRRVGDRDTPTDDRYLFLETLMSARKRLHLSYLGEGVRDGKVRNPAAPLAELLVELDKAARISPEDKSAVRPWRVQHPLQPFDSRYFDASDQRLFTYAKRFEGLAKSGVKPLHGFRQGSVSTQEPLPERIQLRDLKGYYRDPARHLLRDRLQLSLDALDSDHVLPESEPLDGISRIHAVARKVFFDEALPDVLTSGHWDGSHVPDWVALTGLLPPGAPGQAAWRDEANAVHALIETAIATGRFDGVSPESRCIQPVSVRIPVGSEAGFVVLEGSIPNVYALSGGGMQVVHAFPAPGAKSALKDPADIGYGYRVSAFLDWALLRLGQAGPEAGACLPVRLTMLAKSAVDLAANVAAWDELYCRADLSGRKEMDRDLLRRVGRLVGWWHGALTSGTLYYPKTAWAVFQAYRAGAPERGWETVPEDYLLSQVRSAAKNAWDSNDYAMGESAHPPGYASYLEAPLQFGGDDGDADDKPLRAILEFSVALGDLLTLPVPAQEERP